MAEGQENYQLYYSGYYSLVSEPDPRFRVRGSGFETNYSPAFGMCPGYAGSFPAVPGGVAEVRL